jgi:hypothetical protein
MFEEANTPAIHIWRLRKRILNDFGEAGLEKLWCEQLRSYIEQLHKLDLKLV